jgi:hypothetical protein
LLLAIQKTDANNKEIESCQDGYRKTPYYPNEQGLIIQVEDPLKYYSDADQFSVQHHDKLSEMTPDHVAFFEISGHVQGTCCVEDDRCGRSCLRVYNILLYAK